MPQRLRAARLVAALIAAGAIAGTALAVDPSASPSSSPAGSDPAAASAALASSDASASASVEPSVAATPSPSTAPASLPSASAGPQTAQEPEAEGPPSAERVADIVGRLQAAGIPATAAQVQGLAGQVGLGGAVRTLAFAHASGKTPAQIVAMFQSGIGWGRLARELHLSIGPGIGWIMGHGHANGHGNANPKSPTP
jgi:hypothetical protein